jgi:DNA helicase HerA-like ATPase
LTWGEATWQWRHGNGVPLKVDLNKLDLSGAHPEDFAGPGSIKTYTLPGKDLYVYGTITLEMNEDGTVSARPDWYDFDIHYDYSLKENIRNAMTIVDEAVSDAGNKFRIFFDGKVKLQPRPR